MKDDDIFRELFANKPKYEHVPLPDEVLEILKPKDENDYILHAYIVHDEKETARVLAYDKWNGSYIMQADGLASSQFDTPWVMMAKELARDNQRLKKKKNP